MDTNLLKNLSKINIITIEKAPKKRTISCCANVLSSYGDIIDYEKHSPSSFIFSLDIKRDRFINMIEALKQNEFLNHTINMDNVTIGELSGIKPNRINIFLTFLKKAS